MRLLGKCREAVPIYGSDGFTSYTMDELRARIAAWAERGLPA